MATNTSRLGLLKKDTATDGNDTFNIKTMLNDNWDLIDAKVATLGADGKVPAEQLSITAPADASTTQKGVVMLEDSVASTSVTKAATPKSVKTAYDLAQSAFQSASDGKILVANAITAKGQTASGNDTFAQLATAISAISVGRRTMTGTVKSSSTTASFQYAGSTSTVLKNYVSSSVLEFKPSYIFTFGVDISGLLRLTIYFKSPIDTFYNGESIKMASFGTGGVNQSSYSFRGDASTAAVSDTSFTLPTDATANTDVNWVAIE